MVINQNILKLVKKDKHTDYMACAQYVDWIPSGFSDEINNAFILQEIYLEKEIDADLIQLTSTKKEIMAVLDQLDEPYISLIYKRYFESKSWEQISKEMNYSVRWITGYVNHLPGLHIRALNAVQEILDKSLP